MSNIIRVEHSKNYTVISNDAIRDKRLGLKARGLHHLLLSYPDNWKISIEHLAKEASDTDGRTAIQNALKELEVFGYLTREQVRDEKGRITGWENVVRELPQAGFPIVDKSTSGKHHNRKNRKRENPDVDNPPMENPATENQYLINTDSYELSNYEVSIPPLSPQGDKEHPAAYGDVGSLGASTPTLQTEEARLQLQNELAPEEMGKQYSSESNSVIIARDNKTSKPKHTPQGDAYFGTAMQEKRQRSFAAKMQRTIIPIEEMQPWGDDVTYKAFEAYLLEEAKKWKCGNPASYVARKLQDISVGKAPKTEFEQWQAQQQPQQNQEQEPEHSPLTPEQEAWVAIAREITTVSEGAYINVTPHREFWRVASNLAVFNGWLHEVMGVVPLSALPSRLRIWYPDCYRLAKQKSPHLPLPAPLSEDNRAS